jgi:hypothetical protein
VSVGPENLDAGRAEMVLLARPDDLRTLHACADLPAHFLTVFSGGLYDTAEKQAPGDLVRLWKRYDVVGLDVGLLESSRTSSRREQHYLVNLSQMLAKRRVVLLAVLRDLEIRPGASHLTFLRARQVAGPAVVCRPADQTLGDTMGAFGSDGLVVKLEEKKLAGGLTEARLRVMNQRSDGPLVAAKCTGVCDLAALLEFEPDGEDLVSRWFDGKLSGKHVPLVDVLQDCAERQEHAMLEQIVSVWLGAEERMQDDTQRFTHFELVVVATRAITQADRALLDRFQKRGRVWLMTDRLRAGGDMRQVVHAVYVWPDAVASLLARLALTSPAESERGYYSWRSFTFGARSDQRSLELLREHKTTELLEEVQEEPARPTVELVGPFEPIQAAWAVKRPQIEDGAVDWDKPAKLATAEARVSEQRWCDDHREAGDDLGDRRMNLGRLAADPAEDPERQFSQNYWSMIHQGPGVLRRFAAGRHLRGEVDVLGEMRKHHALWQAQLDGRRTAAQEREQLLQRSEEVDRAYEFHLGVVPRLVIGAVVSLFVGFLCLNVIRVLVLISPTTWFTGALMFLLALLGGFAGALFPAWRERRRGQVAAAALDRHLAAVDQQHRELVAEGYELGKSAESLRQILRVEALRKRTVLLAERAWSIVREARDDVARQFQQRKLFKGPVAAAGSTEALAGEDRREWRLSAVIQPGSSVALDLESSEAADAFQAVWRDFLSEWRSDLAEEDPLETGFLRASVLQQLVFRLSDHVAAQVEREVLLQLDRQVTEQDVKLTDWVEPFRAAIGPDLTFGAMQSVLYEGNVEDYGSYRWLYRDEKFARELLSELQQKLPTEFGRVEVSEEPFGRSLPLGGFAVLFHELEVHWGADGVSLLPGRGPEAAFGGEEEGA